VFAEYAGPKSTPSSGGATTSTTLAHEVGRLLALHRRTVALAESCTGGLLGHHITNVSGCSSYFVGSVVAYHDHVKAKLLSVSEETLAQHGAVGAATALEMAKGVRQLLGADIGLAVTGIAGPTGGTAQKPVGLAFIALADESGYEACNEHRWTGDREANKSSSAEAALEMLRAYLSRSDTS
jgi:PncC family amidohydrolase